MFMKFEAFLKIRYKKRVGIACPLLDIHDLNNVHHQHGETCLPESTGAKFPKLSLRHQDHKMPWDRPRNSGKFAKRIIF